MAMKLADNPPKESDEVITEVRAIKRTISERHNNDIDRLLEALIAQEIATGVGLEEPDPPQRPGV
jgi:hypothetical protein